MSNYLLNTGRAGVRINCGILLLLYLGSHFHVMNLLRFCRSLRSLATDKITGTWIGDPIPQLCKTLQSNFYTCAMNLLSIPQNWWIKVASPHHERTQKLKTPQYITHSIFPSTVYLSPFLNLGCLCSQYYSWTTLISEQKVAVPSTIV